jgi:hypothetical protein
MSYATCRGCGSAFRKDGYAAQDAQHPRLCRDCAARELGHHPHHAPGVVCLHQYLTHEYAR